METNLHFLKLEISGIEEGERDISQQQLQGQGNVIPSIHQQEEELEEIQQQQELEGTKSFLSG